MKKKYFNIFTIFWCAPGCFYYFLTFNAIPVENLKQLVKSMQFFPFFRSTARRVRTFSASSVTGSKKKLFVATPKSPESYRPVSKLPRKNSGTLVPTNSPIRGRKLLPTTTSNTPTRSLSTSGVKR